MQEGRWGDIWQFFNLEWGKNQRAKAVPVYAAAWIAMVARMRSGSRSLIIPKTTEMLTSYSIMPLTYYPILRIAADRNIVGKHANNRSRYVAES